MAVSHKMQLLLSIVLIYLLVPDYCSSQTLWGISQDDSGYIYNYNIPKKKFNLVFTFPGNHKASNFKVQQLVNKNSDAESGVEQSADTLVMTGYQPQGVLLKGNDRYVYGITKSGGTYDKGVLFRVDTLSMKYEEILSFDQYFNIEGNPILCDSMIYVSGNYGPYQKGCIIGYSTLSLNSDTLFLNDNFWWETGSSPGKDGTIILPFRELTRLKPTDHSTSIICGTPSMSLYGMGAINELEDGDFYQSYLFSGSSEAGHINKYDAKTNQLISVYNTNYNVSTEIIHPRNAFFEDDEGNPVGCTAWNNENPGKIYGFNMNEDVVYEGYSHVNKRFHELHHFTDSTGIIAGSDLIKSNHHTIYGTTQAGGRYGKGTIFEMDINTHKYNVLYDFEEISGAFPLFGHLLIMNDYSTTYVPPLVDSSVILFPNPTSGILTTDFIQSGDKSVEITIYDISGKLKLMNHTINAETPYLDISNLPAGIYIVKINTGSIQKTSKIIKQ